MKKYIYCALIALLCIACSKEDDPSMDTPLVIPQTLSAYTPELDSQDSNSKGRALCEAQAESWDDSETVDSRTYAVIDSTNSSEYFQYWSEGDAISVFFTTANLKYKLQNPEENNDVGIFELDGENIEGDELETDYYYSVYPYKTSTQIEFDGHITYNFPETQYYNGDSYAREANAMLAVEPIDDMDNIFEFKNLCGYLKLQLKKPSNQDKAVVKKIILNSYNNNNPLAGTCDIIVRSNTPIVSKFFTSTNTITLDCGNGVELKSDSITDFWFVLPALYNNKSYNHHLKGGFDIKVIFEEGPSYRKSTTKDISIKRNHIKPMEVLRTEIPVPLGTIIYKYKDPVTNTDSLNFINHEGDKNFTDANGNLLYCKQTYNKETKEWHITFPEGELMNIGNNVFDFNKTDNLDYIIINNEPGININDHAFYNCTAESIEFYNDVNIIDHNAFGASNIKNIQINGNVNTIATNAAAGSIVEELKIQGNVTTIDTQAFYKADIKNLTIQGTVKSIGNSAFEECKNLNSITLNGVETIGWYAFKYCRNLSSIVIKTDDDTILTLGEGVFADCTNLTTVTLDAKIPPIFDTDNSESDGPYVFPPNKTLLIYVPTITDYQNSDYKYPNNENLKNWWPKYYNAQLREMQ